MVIGSLCSPPFRFPAHGRLSTREFPFEGTQKAVSWPHLGFDLGSFALKNQFVLNVLES